ncbi:MAG TPA: hypothetical protein VNF49_07605, partial [Candidatus Binataceae bacterium]|nr:hypothetical protein [Candidatus Binataceae bacterium]
MSRPPLLSTTVALAVFALLLATSPILPMVWDEGDAINRAAGVQAWSGEVRESGPTAFSETAIAGHWRYTVEVEGHPALYGIVIAFGQLLGEHCLPPLTAARLGPMMLFAAAAGAMFYRLARQYSTVAGLGGMAALVTMPRLFAHAHFASFDGPLTSCWILAWALFAPAVEEANASGTPRSAFPTESPRRRYSRSRFWLPNSLPRWRFGLVWGVALGATMSCKFTGWLAPLPFVACAAVYGNRRTARTLAIGLVTALAIFWLTNPRLWHHPLDGMRMFFDLNLNRAGTALDIPTLFFGTQYTTLSGLPWYNTLVWTAITVPVGTLLLACVGIASVLCRWAADAQGVLILLNWLVLIVVRALPGTPVHDAERLILPSFAFLAALAGVGCHALLGWARTSDRSVNSSATESRRAARGRCAQIGPTRLSGRMVLAGIGLVYLGSASSLVWYAPQWLSYYNLLIGGLRGAEAAGMEATYYWDALDGEVLAWLHAHTAADENIEFSVPSHNNLVLMRQWGTLRRGWRPGEPGRYRWRVIQRRPTFWSSRDRWLVEHE